MKLTTRLGFFIMALFALALTLPLIAGATVDNSKRVTTRQKRVIMQVLQENNYGKWKEAVGKKSPIRAQVNRSNFDTYASYNNQIYSSVNHLQKIGIPLEIQGLYWGNINFDQEWTIANNKVSLKQLKLINKAMIDSDSGAWRYAVGKNSPIKKYLNDNNFWEYIKVNNEIINAKNELRNMGVTLELQDNVWGEIVTTY